MDHIRNLFILKFLFQQKMELSSQTTMNRHSSYDLPSSTRSGGIFWHMKQPWFRTVCIVILCLVVLICVYVAGFAFGRKSVFNENSPFNDEIPTAIPYVNLEWNGTCPLKESICPKSYQGIPPLILISLDGFRPEYLNRGITPNLQSILECGSSAPNMYPSHPSKTFPNHYTIVTGLYPESHGIVDNVFYDPKKRKLFEIGNKEFLKPYWWGGEPIWVTAQKQGKRSHLYFWPGSEVEIKGVRPAVYRKYDSKVKFPKRVKTVLEWLDLQEDVRPHFITLYMNQPDKAGHYFGTGSKEVDEQLIEVDKMMALLFYGLEERDLLNCVNVIIVSDHGMADIKCNRVINLDDYINSTVYHVVSGAYGRLKPKGRYNETEIKELVEDLQCRNDHWRVYRKQELPVRFHYSNNRRIEPIFVDIDSGWSLVTTEKMSYCDGGKHGYDNYDADMQAIFIAHGPSFKSNFTAKPFLNIELYELMSELLQITASPNNGTKGSLHSLLESPQILSEQVEPNYPRVGTVALDNMEHTLRVYAANCTCNQDVEVYNQKDVENITELQELHLPFGIPHTHEINQSHLLLYNYDYISSYDVKYRLPMWSSFTLSQKDQNSNTTITDCWRGDARIPFKDTSTCSDYNTTIVSSKGIRQRHLFPPMFASQNSMKESYLVTNSVPKSEEYDSFVENRINNMLSSWLQIKGSINVVTGPAFSINGTGIYPGITNIMRTHEIYGPLVMPTHYFYIISWCDSFHVPIQSCNYSNIEVTAYLLPNFPFAYECKDIDSMIKRNVARVTDVENLSGISFFTKLPIYEAIRLRISVPQKD